jgi:hypothetical protein
MAHAAIMGSNTPDNIYVIDFRRQGMFLQWQVLRGTWVACDVPPALVHGIALIRASGPNICLFGRGGQLHLQVGPDRYSLSGDSLRIKCRRVLASLGLRKRFTVEEGTGVLYGYSYWTGQGDDFFRWLASRTTNPEWRAANGQRWSEGVDAAVVRSS